MSVCPCEQELAIYIWIPELIQIIQCYVHHLTDAATFRLCNNIDLHVVCARIEQKQKRGQKKKPPSKYPIYVGPKASEFCLPREWPNKTSESGPNGIKYASIRVWLYGTLICLGMKWRGDHVYDKHAYFDTRLAADPEEFCHRCVFRQLLPENRLHAISELHAIHRDGPFLYPTFSDVPKEFDLACEWMQNAVFQARVDAGLWNKMHGCD
jgi:hypothetical protein